MTRNKEKHFVTIKRSFYQKNTRTKFVSSNVASKTIFQGHTEFLPERVYDGP